MRVHVITRVNLKYDPDFVFTKERLELLKTKVKDAMRAQSFKDFKRIGLVDGPSAKHYMSDLFDIFDYILPSYKGYLEAFQGKEVFSIRLDSDDIPKSGYIQTLIDGIDRNLDIQLVVANIGTDHNTNTGEAIEVQVDYPIGFFGLYEKNLVKGCYEGDHKKMDYNTKYTSEYSQRSLWTRNIHGENRGSKSLLYKYQKNAI
ncbi:MAG TPA: hypothetical protein P5155_00765 [Candidatus Absconditabacterales bacterium]|nr:hypothetical protein [Candidatus Absconditabacterales bacterium]